MQDEKNTYTLVPPALLNQLAKSETLWNTYDFSTLRAVGSGSAPLSPWMIDIFDNKYLTPTLKIKRKDIEDQYKGEVTAVLASKAQ